MYLPVILSDLHRGCCCQKQRRSKFQHCDPLQPGNLHFIPVPFNRTQGKGSQRAQKLIHKNEYKFDVTDNSDNTVKMTVSHRTFVETIYGTKFFTEKITVRVAQNLRFHMA